MDKSVQIYPNPTHGEITVTGHTIRDLEIFDVHGRPVSHSRSIEHPTSVSIASAHSCILFVKVITDAGTAIRKVVVQ
jgi:hypothetical protein